MPTKTNLQTSIPPDVLNVSEAWKAKKSPEELMALLGCVSRHRALGVIVNYRNTYGKQLFPYRKQAIAQGGYSASKVARLSKLWQSGCTKEEFAKAANLAKPDSTWGTVQHLRTKFGKELFPQRVRK